MKEKKVPYVGVTGFMSREEVQEVLSFVSPWLKRKIMIGVLASSKTINGGTNSRPNRYPTPGQMGDIFEDTSRALNLVHFSTKNKEGLFEEMARALNLAGPYCHGLQLNIAWPDPKVLAFFKTKVYPVTTILQIGTHALEMVGHSPQRLADKIEREYKHFIDYVLLDPSGGIGKHFDPEEMMGYLHALEAKQMSMGLGVAGGLSPVTLGRLISPLVKEFPDLSIDVETGVRNWYDHLDPKLAISFIRKAECIFQ